MSETENTPRISNEKSNSTSIKSLEERRQILEEVRKEYFAVSKVVQERQRKVNETREDFGRYANIKNHLVEQRDELNKALREKRREIRNIEADLVNAKEELAELEIEVSRVRKEIPQANRIVQSAFQEHESAKNRLEEAQKSLEIVTEQLRDIEAAYLAAGGTLPGKTFTRNNPWISGSFYVVAAVVLIVALAVISENVSWYALILVTIGGLLSIAIIGALQLRNDDALSEENFITLMVESFKRLPLLRESSNSADKNDVVEPSE